MIISDSFRISVLRLPGVPDPVWSPEKSQSYHLHLASGERLLVVFSNYIIVIHESARAFWIRWSQTENFNSEAPKIAFLAPNHQNFDFRIGMCSNLWTISKVPGGLNITRLEIIILAEKIFQTPHFQVVWLQNVKFWRMFGGRIVSAPDSDFGSLTQPIRFFGMLSRMQVS